MVEGRSPYDRPEPMASLIAIITDQVQFSAKSGPLWQVIEGLLDKNPDTRLTALEAGRLLDEIARDGKVTSVPAPREPVAAATQALPATEEVSELRQPGAVTGREKEEGGLGLFDTETRPGARPDRGGRATALIVGAIVLVTALVVGGLIWAQSNDDEKPTGPGGTPTAQGTATQTPGATPTTTPSPTVPAGFRRYSDPSGYSLLLPDGFTGPTRKDAENHFYYGPNGVQIQIGQTDKPGPSALADWQESDRQQKGGSGFRDYQLVRLEKSGDQPPVPDTGDGSKSADWEFTFAGDSGGRMHVLNRGFVMGNMGYAILVMAPESSWTETWTRLRPVFEGFKGRS